MTDDEPLYIEDDGDFPDADDGKNADRRRLLTRVAIAAAIFIIVLALLMLRGWGSILNTASRNGSTNQIVAVEGLRPVGGSISVWLAAGTDLPGALTAAGIHSLGIVDMGGGRFVVSVPPGTEVDAARVLRDNAGVYDAGRVYADETTATP